MNADGWADEADDLWEPAQPQARNNNNNPQQPDDVPVIEGPERNEDGSLDAGIAIAPGDTETTDRGRKASDAELLLLIECTEELDFAPDHPILRPGVTVAVGFSKNTKLSYVFERYVAFCYQHSSIRVQASELEFVHCSLLNKYDTAESSALMKNDRISVRKVRKSERDAEAERNRFQRESDREYFKRLRLLMPDMIGGKDCDLLLDCRGKLVDSNGLNQEVLQTVVKGHSAILSKRCKWLARTIQTARDEFERRSVVTIPSNENHVDVGDEQVSPVAAIPRGVVEDTISPKGAARSLSADDEDDDEFGVVQYLMNRNQHQNPLVPDDDNRTSGATEIENDEEDEQALPDSRSARGEAPDHLANRSGSPVFACNHGSSSMLWVVLPNQPPEAVKLLLEYCYTNRVIALGQDAFLESCRTKPSHGKGVVSPFQRTIHGSGGWPNNGLPQVPFPVALAGIKLAEEASMPRFSLMCEVAAAQLVSRSNFLEALSLCTSQQQSTGNNLPLLREAAMAVIMLHGPRGVDDICRTSSFKRVLKDKSIMVVPSLLAGTKEALGEPPKNLPPHLSGSKRELSLSTRLSFKTIDREDAYERMLERRKRHLERHEGQGTLPDGIFIKEEEASPSSSKRYSAFISEPAKMSLKRMSHSLGALARTDGNQSSYQALLGRRRRSRSSGNKGTTRRRTNLNKK